MKYLLVDTLNVFFRARHMAPVKSDVSTKIGFSLHVMLTIVNKSWKKEKADHVVFCLEGKSWRKQHYQNYKQNRVELRELQNEKQKQEDQEIYEAFGKFINFLQTKTNVTVLHNDIAEADDLIARWIHIHPNDNHVILSSDSDFIQLLSEKVSIYNGIQNHLITTTGIYNDTGKPVKDKKTKLPKQAPNPKWELFEKCMRGDSSDNIFSAYPGVRTKSSKNKIGLLDAFEDMDKRGYNWNNLMLQRWTDHKGNEHRVLDDYYRNVSLVDLTAQPDEIKKVIDNTILTRDKKSNTNVGRYFLQFCGEFDLKKIADYSDQYVDWLRTSE